MSYSREPSLCGFLCDISSDASEQLLLIESRSMLGAPANSGRSWRHLGKQAENGLRLEG